jgi:hypothetical protein
MMKIIPYIKNPCGFATGILQFFHNICIILIAVFGLIPKFSGRIRPIY